MLLKFDVYRDGRWWGARELGHAIFTQARTLDQLYDNIKEAAHLHFEEEVERFQHSFTEDELEALRRFHRFFELRLAMIPASSRESEEWPQNDSWSNVVKDARNLLNLFSLDGDSLRSEVFEMFMQTLRTSLDRPDLREVFARKNLTASLYPSS